MLIQQRLPSLKTPLFDGSAANYVLFISSFYDMVHKQPYLDVFQKRWVCQWCAWLHMLFEATEVYVWQSMRRSSSHDPKSDSWWSDSDQKSLAVFFYAVSSCLNTLTKMNFTADIYSTDVLRQTLRRLPNYLVRKWSEYSFNLQKKRRTEPHPPGKLVTSTYNGNQRSLSSER